MTDQEKLEYSQMEPGYEFPKSRFELTPETVARYIKAVGETSKLYHDTRLVPPSAVAAYAQAALMKHISLVPGSIHVSQELEFLDSVNTDDTITIRARVGRKQERSGMRLLAIAIEVFNQHASPVMKGKISFILP